MDASGFVAPQQSVRLSLAPLSFARKGSDEVLPSRRAQLPPPLERAAYRYLRGPEPAGRLGALRRQVVPPRHDAEGDGAGRPRRGGRRVSADDGLRLLTPGQIGRVETRNRFIRSATYETLADERGLPTAGYLELHRRLAAGGVGLNFTGFVSVHPSGKYTPSMPNFETDEHVEAFARVAGRGARGGREDVRRDRPRRQPGQGGREHRGAIGRPKPRVRPQPPGGRRGGGRRARRRLRADGRAGQGGRIRRRARPRRSRLPHLRVPLADNEPPRGPLGRLAGEPAALHARGLPRDARGRRPRLPDRLEARAAGLRRGRARARGGPRRGGGARPRGRGRR